MRIWDLLSKAAVFLILGSSDIGRSQNVVHLHDVPFIATQVFTSKDSKNRNRVARASNGSIYVASFDAQGSPGWVTIEDVPHQRLIQLEVRHRLYIIEPRSPANTETYSVQQWMGMMNGSQSQSPGQSDLGTRAESGMTLFGTRLTLQGEVIERWEALELGATYAYTTTDTQGVKVNFRLADIQRVEPDPTLFEIPPGYTPAKVSRPGEGIPQR